MVTVCLKCDCAYAANSLRCPDCGTPNPHPYGREPGGKDLSPVEQAVFLSLLGIGVTMRLLEYYGVWL